jgi:hypothetical protein
VKITAVNHGPSAAPLHVLPHVWFRNTWWNKSGVERPSLTQAKQLAVRRSSSRITPELGDRHVLFEAPRELLFTNNETNTRANLWHPNKTQFVKDGINNYVVHGQKEAVNPQRNGTKSAAHYFSFD